MKREATRYRRLRLASLLGLFLILYIILITRALHLQVVSGQALKSLAVRQHTKIMEMPPERGLIFDRNGRKLAASVMADSVFADPSKIKNVQRAADELSRILGTDRDTILRKLGRGKNFCWLARLVPPEQAAQVEALKMDGVFVVKEPKRHYPNGELAGHILGFVGMDAVGLEGLERKYDQYLRGTPQRLVWARDAKGKRIYPRLEKAVVQGQGSYHIILTIDSRIQHLVETHLKEAVLDKGAKGGFAVVMDPRTGEILALANQPGFDPNRFAEGNPMKGKNRVVTDCYDPGSTFKPFVAAAALDARVAKETDRFYCENGHYAVGDRVIHEAQRKRHGTLTFKEIIKYSSNIGTVKIAERLGRERLYEYITKFGFGARTGIDLPGEIPGLLRHYRDWTRIDAATIAFGQGVSVTAIQLVTALSAIANNGILMKPFIIRAIVDGKGDIVREGRPTVVRRVISEQTARRMASILTAVVSDEDGTGKKARIENVNVAGKTGTSQKFDFARRAYSSEKVRTSFMGFFPAEAPQLAMLVVLDEPQRDRWGGVASAPVFKKIGEEILNCYRTDIREYQTAPLRETPNLGTLRFVTAGGPRGGDGDEADLSVAPDFRGLTIREALVKARDRDVNLKIVGHGWAISQDPPPGAALGIGRSCTVTFGTEAGS